VAANGFGGVSARCVSRSRRCWRAHALVCGGSPGTAEPDVLGRRVRLRRADRSDAGNRHRIDRHLCSCSARRNRPRGRLGRRRWAEGRARRNARVVAVGLSCLPDGRLHLYYERNTPGVGLRLVDLGASVSGAPRQVAVRQVSRRPSWWRVYVDGRPVAPPLRLPGSAAGLTPVATGESWQPPGASTGCNRFAFRFRRVRVVDRGARSWARFETGWKVANPPYAVERDADGFTAFSLATA
jgi:hypothetical protein